MKYKKKIVFLTGTRADFGHMKGLINKLETSQQFNPYIFVTGMHMMSKYGSTYIEVVNQKYNHIHPYINQTENTDLDIILSNTILGFSNYVKEVKPNLIIVHGDRVEALAGAIVGSFNNILTAHISGGELTGTIDEFMRHAITKMSHIHFVANEKSKQRLIRMGEKETSIFVIGSPEIDLMLSNNLPPLHEVKKYYNIPFDSYAIFIYHPVTTELKTLQKDIKEIIISLITTNINYTVIYPNNDPGSNIILNEIEQLRKDSNFKLLPSMRFEYFLTLLRNSQFIIGNSSSGIREAPVYGIPSINIGSRQMNRGRAQSIINVKANRNKIHKAIKKANKNQWQVTFEFGKGNAIELFYKTLQNEKLWEIPIQKQFVD